MKDTPISRRDFLKNMGIAGAGAFLAASPWLSAFSEVSEDIYLELCCRDSFGSAGGLDLRADRGLSRQFLCPHGQYGRGTF